MGNSYLLGVDIGTYSSKGCIASESGEILAQSVAGHGLSMPRPGWAEHDPEGVWWADFLLIVSELLEKSGIPANRIAGIGLSSVSPAVVPVDRSWTALRPAILYGIDTRAMEEARELSRLTGVSLSTQSAAPKIMWIRRREPELWKRTDKIVNGSGYLSLKLTGASTIDAYDAAIFAPFFRFGSMDWDDALADLVAPVRMMPEVRWTSDIAGRVSREAALATGLAEGTPVIAGTADAAAEAIGAGLSAPGDMMIMYGSSTFFILYGNSPASSRRYWCGPFLEKGSFAVAGGTSTAGSVTRWFRDRFGGLELEAEAAGGRNAYAALAELAGESPLGARGLVCLPYFSGERTPIDDPDARGVLFGLTLSHSRADVYRSILEGVGFSIRHNLEGLEGEGFVPRRIIAIGGGTQNSLLMKIVSDAAGIAQSLPSRTIGACYGDAFLAGVGVGLFSGFSDVGRWVHLGIAYESDASAHEAYGPYYSLYRELYAANKELMSKIARLGGLVG